MRFLLPTILLSLLLMAANQAHGQASEIDSLENILATQPDTDTARVDVLNSLSALIYVSDSAKALNYCRQAEELSAQLGYWSGMAVSIGIRGNLYSRHLSEKEALAYYKKAISIADQHNLLRLKSRFLVQSAYSNNVLGNRTHAIDNLNDAYRISEQRQDSVMMLVCLGNKSMIYSQTGNYPKALDGLHQALNISQRLNQTGTEAIILNNIGNIHLQKALYPQAMENFLQALKINEKLENKAVTLSNLINVGTAIYYQGNYSAALEYFQKALRLSEQIDEKALKAQCYESIGEIHLKNNSKEAVVFFNKSLEIANSLSLAQQKVSSLFKLGEFYHQQKEYSKAITYYNESAQQAEKIECQRRVSEILLKTGELHIDQKDYDKALRYFNRSIKIAYDLDLFNILKDAHFQISRLNEVNGNHKEALAHYKHYKRLSDSIYNEKNMLQTVELEYTYKLEKEQQKMELAQQKKSELLTAELKHQRSFLMLSIIALTIMTVLAFVLFRLYRTKHRMNKVLGKQKNEIAEKRDLLEQANATKDKFFSIISHDLKGAFNAILGLTDLLLTSEEKDDPKEMKDYALMIHKSAQNAHQLLGNLLQWSMSGIGLVDFKPEYIRFDQIAHTQKHVWQQMAAEKNITLQLDVANDCMLLTDTEMLNTIIRNLVSNAIKYTHSDGQVAIKALNNNETTIITVADTGIGMSQETINGLFNIKGKKSVPGTRNESGTGLGLLLCHEFVTKHGGEIKAQSTQGKGSMFTITLPLPK